MKFVLNLYFFIHQNNRFSLKKKLKILLLSFFSISCFALNPQLDQLKEQLSQHPARDSIRVNILMQLADAYYSMDECDMRLFYLKKALQDALELDNTKFEISILYHISEAHLCLGNHELAEEYTLLSLEESRNHDNWMLDEIITGQAEIEFRKGNYQYSIELSKDVLTRAHENGRTQLEITSLYNIADCMIRLKQYREARTILEKCQAMKYPDDAGYDDYKMLQLMTSLDSATGNFKDAFIKQRQLEMLTAKKYSPEQVQKTLDESLQADLKYLNMKLTHLQTTCQLLKKQNTQKNIVLIVLAFVACCGMLFFVWFRHSFKKLKLEKDRLTDEQALMIEKKNRLSGKQQTLMQNKELLKETHENLTVSNRSKTELFKAISHDLQIPLFRLQQNLTGLMTDISEDQFRQVTAGLTNMVGDISLLLENLLQWSKYQSQGIHAKPQYVEMTALINDTIDQQKYNVAEKKIVISNILEHSIFIYADDEMVKCSLKTILQNIIKLSDTNANITISGNKNNQRGRIQISYTGQMPVKQMFLQQSQADSYGTELTELGKAVSFGWMLCRTLVKINDGDIRVEDVSDESFNIILYFPLEKPETQNKRSKKPPPNPLQ